MSQYHAMEILRRPYPKFHFPVAAMQTIPHEFNKLDMKYETAIGEQTWPLNNISLKRKYSTTLIVLLHKNVHVIKQFSISTQIHTTHTETNVGSLLLIRG